MAMKSKQTSEKQNAGASDFFQTFDSGRGPVVPDSMESDFAHQDSGSGLENYTMNELPMDSVHGGVPEVPTKKYK